MVTGRRATPASVNKVRRQTLSWYARKERAMSPPLIILPAFFLLVAFVLWTALTTWQRNRRLRLLMEFQARLIDRLASLADFAEFASTDAGRQLLNTLAADDFATAPRDRVLRAIEMGVVLVSLGIGLLFLGGYFVFDGREAFTAVGVISGSLGVGFLISAVLSVRLTKALVTRLSDG
jgi:hypothetical protein